MSSDVRPRLKKKLAGCVRTGKITLSSGQETDFYFDGRLVSLDPEGSVLIAELLLAEIQELGISAIGGPTMAADPLTSSVGVLAYQRGVPLKLFYVRKQGKKHGMQRRVEGPPLPADSHVALVDDTLTTGGSLLSARDTLREEIGIEAKVAFVIVDREESGRERLESAGLEVHALFRKRDFLP